MAAFSARQNESDRLAPPAARRDDGDLDEGRTVISADPLAPEEAAPDDSPADSLPVEIADDPARLTREVASTEDCQCPDPAASEAARSGSGASDEVLPEGQTVISRRPPLTDLRPDASYTPHELGQALVGKRLAHFELEEFLGGGMGAVFRGRDLTLGRSVAVKVLPRGQDEDTIRRFRNEAQSAARLNHENIARVYYIGEDDGWSFIIFEHIDGATIRQLVEERGPLSLAEAVRHTLQAAEALDHAHRRDVVHRDIKPSNLIVSQEGPTKLVDLGLARLHQVDAPGNDLTASGVTLGTFDYISPEQARDPRTADVRSDLYSLGCTLYFMLTARPPFPEGTVLQKLLDHQSRQPPDVRVFRPDVPDEAVAILEKLLAKQAEDRYQTPRELIDDLHALIEQFELAIEGPRPVPTAAPPSPPPFWREQLWWLAPTLLLIAAAYLTELRRLEGEGAPALPPIVAPPANAPRPAAADEPKASADPAESSPIHRAAAGAPRVSPPALRSPDNAAGADDSVSTRESSGRKVSPPTDAGAPPSAAQSTPERPFRSPANRSGAEGRAAPDFGSPRGAGSPVAPVPVAPDQVGTFVVGARPSDEDGAVWWFATADEALR